MQTDMDQKQNKRDHRPAGKADTRKNYGSGQYRKEANTSRYAATQSERTASGKAAENNRKGGYPAHNGQKGKERRLYDERREKEENRYHGKYDHTVATADTARPSESGMSGGAGQDLTEEGGLVIGRNGVRELLRSGRPVDKLLVRRGDREGSIVVLVAEAVSRGIPVIEVDREKLDAMAGFAPHQGVIAMAAEKEYVPVEEILESARMRGEDPLLVIADGLTDPYNLGALIRCAEGLGAHGLIIPKRRAVGLTPLVSKASAGAIAHLPVAKVTNLAQTVADLQKAGVWVYAAEAGGKNYDTMDFTGPCALIFGSEGNGVSALLKERCDGVVSIPMMGHVNSLNVSTAAAIVIAEASRQHRLDRERRMAGMDKTVTAGKQVD